VPWQGLRASTGSHAPSSRYNNNAKSCAFHQFRLIEIEYSTSCSSPSLLSSSTNGRHVLNLAIMWSLMWGHIAAPCQASIGPTTSDINSKHIFTREGTSMSKSGHITPKHDHIFGEQVHQQARNSPGEFRHESYLNFRSLGNVGDGCAQGCVSAERL
jgi:hypothetical protein